MDDDDFMVEDDDQFDFEDEEGEEEEEEEDGVVDLENKYYNAKALKEDNPEEALTEFQAVVDAENEQGKGEWGFKASKQMLKLCLQEGDNASVLKYYRQVLNYMDVVSRNDSEKSINNILDKVSSSSDMTFLEQFYEITLNALSNAKNERLWTKTNLKLAKLWLDRQEYTRLLKILRPLYESCQNDDGSGDQRKGTLLLELYALEIQMYTETKNTKKLKELYKKCLDVKSAIPHPRIMGVIRECGGKMHMGQQEWERAQTDFFEAFKSYEEAGSLQRTQCLKYLVLAHMLMESTIDPFDSQETKPYKNNKEILAMTNLVNAYHRKDIRDFQKILRDNKQAILDDPFIRTYIDDVLKNIRASVLVALIKPYTRIEINFISKHLSINAQEVEELLVGLILDGKVSGRIDQVNQRLELDEQTTDSIHYKALGKWSSNVGLLTRASLGKINWPHTQT